MKLSTIAIVVVVVLLCIHVHILLLGTNSSGNYQEHDVIGITEVNNKISKLEMIKRFRTGLVEKSQELPSMLYNFAKTFEDEGNSDNNSFYH